MKRAVLYARVSGDDRGKEDRNLAGQLEMGRKYAREHGYDISLRQELETPEPTRGTGSPRRWRPRTPAIAAGITDHVWTTTELLSYRVPVWFLDQLPEIAHLFPPLDSDGRQGN